MKITNDLEEYRDPYYLRSGDGTPGSERDMYAGDEEDYAECAERMGLKMVGVKRG